MKPRRLAGTRRRPLLFYSTIGRGRPSSAGDFSWGFSEPPLGAVREGLADHPLKGITYNHFC